MHRTSPRVIQALVLAAWCAAAALAPSLARAQATAAGSRAPGPSRFEVFGGYTYFHPLGTTLEGYRYEPIARGAIVSATGYFTRHVGLQAEGQFSPHGPDDCVYTAQGGPVVRFQFGRVVPFGHLLGGRVRVGGPVEQPCTWGLGATGGGGLDYVLPNPFLRNHVALRLIQADYTYSHVDFGPSTPPVFLNGGLINMKAYRLSAGVVLRFGDMEPNHPAAYGCEVQPANVFPGDPVTVTGRAINMDEGRKLHPVYTWSSTGGKVSGTTETATVDTAGLAPGDYTVTGHVSEGKRVNQHADCSAGFRVHAYEPPTIACSANPSSILPEGVSTITAQAVSPQNRQLNLSYATTAGQITGNGPTATLAATGVGPGTITVTCNTVDDMGHAASASTQVTVVAPPPPPAPQARPLCSVSFERDRRRPVRVDNEAKGCLDDIALEMNREPESILMVIGKHDPQEKPEAAAERTLNIRLYLANEKGIDPARIQLRTGESTSRSADNILVPPGATWDPGGTTSFDPTRVQRHGEPYARPPR
ncbi:MAG: hypothetical protein M3O02_10040 [Acidobacteriota bacterium]|nr:hypothetical protein [Acidobacteriota bacterium]